MADQRAGSSWHHTPEEAELVQVAKTLGQEKARGRTLGGTEEVYD